MIQETVSHYRILEKLGGGGMGVVYKAPDLRLDRFVALKFLPPTLTRDVEANKRFMQEAKAASALDHPHICTVYEIDNTPNGETLKKRIERGPLAVNDALKIAIETAQGLASAHASGIVHRDIKPANIMITRDDVTKILDFGLAKLTGEMGLTQTGSTMGTVAYMSPEQIRGDDLDFRTDVWSLGVVLYEMLAGRRPFPGDKDVVTMHAITSENPDDLARWRPDAPLRLRQIVARCLEKNRERRYASAADLSKDLSECYAAQAAPVAMVNRFLRASWKRVAATALLAVVLIGVGALWAWNRGSDTAWARNQAVPQIRQLIAENRIVSAYEVAQRAERFIPRDPELAALWPDISGTASLDTTPPGAEIQFKEYSDVKADWISLGKSPLSQLRLPQGMFRIQVRAAGYEPRETVMRITRDPATIRLTLREQGSVPAGMVAMEAGQLDMGFPVLRGDYPPISAPGFFIDRYEVTNEQFKAFVDAGGYQSAKYWKTSFLKDKRELSGDEAMAQFRDTTGRPGPSTWSVGTFPEGQAKYPVSGVSWYEAGAYCEFAGKTLPTLYHWGQSASVNLSNFVTPLSNFGGKGPAPVGAMLGLTRSGAYDMAGNMREWVWNASDDDQRYLVGGSWNEPEYKFFEPETRSTFDRSSTNGFRCAIYEGKEPIPQAAMRNVHFVSRDYANEQPVSDQLFEAYKSQFLYDAKELNAVVDKKADARSEHSRREKVSFDAAYAAERVTAYLYLPKSGSPPYQVVVCFPGQNAIGLKSSDDMPEASMLDFLTTSGRAVMFPIFKGTYERSKPDLSFSYQRADRVYKNYVIWWVQDFMRSVDYLATRPDIDSKKVAYFGVSWGGRMGGLVPAVETRIRAAVLTMAGLARQPTLPEADSFNFAKHVTIPVLMLGGQYDYDFPLEISQRPLFNLLGTPAADKRHVVYDGVGHDIPTTRRNDMIRETLAWLDKYLGPVR